MPDAGPARHVVLLAHPGDGSFCATVARRYCETVREQRQEAVLRDLYAIGFDPLLKESERPGSKDFTPAPDVAAEIEAIRDSDVFVLVYPIWFGMPPAMLLGYVDRVLGAGVPVEAVQRHAGQSVLSHRRLLTITSSGAREVWLNAEGQVESLRNSFSRYLTHAFGMTSCEHLHFGGVVEGLAERFIGQNLHEVHERARKICAAVAVDRRTAVSPS